MSSKAVTRVGDKTVGHGRYKPRATLDSLGAPDSNVGGSDNVFVNKSGVNRVGDRWRPHTPAPNDPHANDTDGSPDLTLEPDPPTDVYANRKRVARVGDKVEDDTIAGGSPNVFIGDNSEFASFTVAEIAFLVEQADVDFVTPSNVTEKSARSSRSINSGLSSGIVSTSSSLLSPTIS